MRKIVAIFTLLFAIVGVTVMSVGVANAAPQTVIDRPERTSGPAKGFNSLTVDYGLPGSTSLSVGWNWDDTTTSGANTRDACSLFDTDGDGLANYAFCMTVDNTTTVSTTRLYICTADSPRIAAAGRSSTPRSRRPGRRPTSPTVIPSGTSRPTRRATPATRPRNANG